MSAPKPGDMQAGFIGLIAGAFGIGAVLYAMVHLTSLKYERHDAAEPAAAAK